MAITTDHLVGLAVGVGTAAAAYYLYKKNQSRVDEWLRQQGVNLPAGSGKDHAAMNLEELVREKERLEDLIAEREMTDQAQKPPEQPQAAAS